MRTQILEDVLETGCLESRTLCAQLFSKCAMSSLSFWSLFLPDNPATSWTLHLSSFGSWTQAVTIPGRVFGRPRPAGRPMTQRTSCTAGARTLFSVHAQSINWYIMLCKWYIVLILCLRCMWHQVRIYHQHYMPQIGSDVQSNCTRSMVKCNISGTCRKTVRG